ncbi:MAG: hypothetical protein C4518_06725 [Desulfobacteraceae bacterium]|nr:MAG: hypothetical protein C4518_06725 [Desulfobacteraceae bacterium]
MIKPIGKKTNQGSISKKVLASLKKANNQKVINFADIKEAGRHAEEMNKSVISKKNMEKYDPLHAIYIYAQNQMSIIVEQISDLHELSKLANAYEQAEDLYMPSGPPMSPLTKSYFTCWGFFDLCIGLQKETFGTVAIDLCKFLNVDKELIQVFECMQKSRMGVYRHKGVYEKYVILEDVVTRQEITTVVPSGYLGKADQIWFARILPEPFPDLNAGYSVVFTTPYVLSEMQDGRLVNGTEEKWRLFFERTIPKTGIKDEIRAFETLMKYGRNRHYWNEFIFEGYVNHQYDMIFLAGFPDIPLSRPHSSESQKRESY